MRNKETCFAWPKAFLDNGCRQKGIFSYVCSLTSIMIKEIVNSSSGLVSCWRLYGVPCRGGVALVSAVVRYATAVKVLTAKISL